MKLAKKSLFPFCCHSTCFVSPWQSGLVSRILLAGQFPNSAKHEFGCRGGGRWETGSTLQATIISAMATDYALSSAGGLRDGSGAPIGCARALLGCAELQRAHQTQPSSNWTLFDELCSELMCGLGAETGACGCQGSGASHQCRVWHSEIGCFGKQEAATCTALGPAKLGAQCRPFCRKLYFQLLRAFSPSTQYHTPQARARHAHHLSPPGRSTGQSIHATIAPLAQQAAADAQAPTRLPRRPCSW